MHAATERSTQHADTAAVGLQVSPSLEVDPARAAQATLSAGPAAASGSQGPALSTPEAAAALTSILHSDDGEIAKSLLAFLTYGREPK